MWPISHDRTFFGLALFCALILSIFFMPDQFKERVKSILTLAPLKKTYVLGEYHKRILMISRFVKEL
jgi:hypothetical protein